MINSLRQQAEGLLQDNNLDEAIDILRIPESNENAELAALLALAYFKRGDTKGDVYASSFFAERAIALGKEGDSLLAIIAIGLFRKQRYAESAEIFAKFANEKSGYSTCYLYGLTLYFSGSLDESKKWLSIALKKNETDECSEALKRTEKALQGAEIEFPEAPEIIQGNLGGLKDKRSDSPTPSRECALSKKLGYADTSKDLYWTKKNIPCQEACPAHTDIPGYLSEIYKGNFEKAYKINLRDNVFPGVLGRVCARPCEGECRHGWEDLGDSVAICFSKRSAHDHQNITDPVVMEPIFPETGKKVAVIGAGPSGLAAARNLALYGHYVTVYEQHEHPGGMMVQGIPAFRLPRRVIDKEIEQIRLLGVEIITDCSIGEDIKLSQLKEENDAVIIAAGTLKPNMLDIPGKELDGIMHGLEFLLEVNHKEDSLAGKNVIVIGGGFTAMDCARTAKRMGAKLIQLEDEESKADWKEHALNISPTNAQVYYRRSPEEMLVTPGEVEELGHEGIDMQFLVSPVEFIGEDGNLTSIKFIKNELGEPDRSGRRSPVPIERSEFTVPADLVLLATGQFPQTNWIDGEFQKDLVAEDGWPSDYRKHNTSIDKIFLAGDFSTGAQSLIDAIAHGKETAIQADTFLMGSPRIKESAYIEDSPEGSERIVEMNDVPLQEMPTLPIESRSLNAEVELGYDQEHAVDEAQRCYQCNLKYEIDPEKCIYCDWCVKAKPRPDCIVKIKELTYGDNGEITGFIRSENSEETNLIYINQEDCIRCGACVNACPVDAISLQRVSRTKKI